MKGDPPSCGSEITSLRGHISGQFLQSWCRYPPLAALGRNKVAPRRPGMLLHLPNLGPRPPRRSACPEANVRPATIPGFPAPGFLPGFPPSAGARAAPRWRTATGRVLPPRPRPLLRRPLPARARRRAGGSGCGPGWWGRGPRCGSWWGWGCFTL